MAGGGVEGEKGCRLSHSDAFHPHWNLVRAGSGSTEHWNTLKGKAVSEGDGKKSISCNQMWQDIGRAN